MPTFGDRVKQERERLRWSHQELATRVSAVARKKCPKVTIEKIESRGSKQSQWSRPLARALGVSHDWLVTGEGQRAVSRSIDRLMSRLSTSDYEELYNEFVERIAEKLEMRAKRDPSSDPIELIDD